MEACIAPNLSHTMKLSHFVNKVILYLRIVTGDFFLVILHYYVDNYATIYGGGQLWGRLVDFCSRLLVQVPAHRIILYSSIPGNETELYYRVPCYRHPVVKRKAWLAEYPAIGFHSAFKSERFLATVPYIHIFLSISPRVFQHLSHNMIQRSWLSADSSKLCYFNYFHPNRVIKQPTNWKWRIRICSIINGPAQFIIPKV